MNDIASWKTLLHYIHSLLRQYIHTAENGGVAHLKRREAHLKTREPYLNDREAHPNIFNST